MERQIRYGGSRAERECGLTKTYTVLGGMGFIGSHLYKTLQKTGDECLVPARRDAALFERPLGTIFYCIGLTNDYKDRPFDTVEAHASLLNRIVEKSSFDRLVYLSSTRLYDGLSSTAEETNLVLNSANPRHIYDLSKALGENICLTASGGRACVARLSSVYSDAQDASGFVPDLLRRMKQEKKFELDSSSGVVRDYIHIDDVVAGLIALAEQSQLKIVNIASGENISNQTIADTLKGCGYDVSIKRKTDLEKPPACDISKLKSLGITPVGLTEFLKGKKA